MTEITVQIRHVPTDVHKAAKLAAVEQGISLNAWLIEAIRIRLTQIGLEELKQSMTKKGE